MNPPGGSERVVFTGPAGRLEGLWLPSGSGAGRPAVVLCHPHPLHGGTMETKLVVHTARSLGEAGFQTLRFNFRGVGQSEGAWDEGRGEREDLGAALDFTQARLPGAWVGVFGFSFGAVVALDVGQARPEVRALAGAAPPVRFFPPDFLGDCVKPKLIVSAGRDEIVDPSAVARWAGGLPPPADFRVFEEADHLFVGRTEEVAAVVARFMAEQAGTPGEE